MKDYLVRRWRHVQEAAEAGMTVQQYADWKLLDADPGVPVGGRRVGQRPLEGLTASAA